MCRKPVILWNNFNDSVASASISDSRRQLKMLSKLRQTRGFTLLEVMIVVLIIGVILGIAIPNWLNSRKNSRARVCMKNLSQIDSAKEQYALESKVEEGVTCSMADLNPFLKSEPACPANGNYSINPIGTPAECDYIEHR